MSAGMVSGVERLYPNGTNSTHFTTCCGTAICLDEKKCPGCGNLVIGHDAETDSSRTRQRWFMATKHWKR